MELSGVERAVAWISLVLAAGLILVSADLLTGGRLFGWSPMPAASRTEGEAVDGE